jgi:hypothetical protein
MGQAEAQGKAMNDYFEPRPPSNPWAYWQSKLEGLPMQMNPDNPQAGFYRQPYKRYYGARRTFTPVAYWPSEDGSKLNCRLGDQNISETAGMNLWKSVGNHPVAEHAYRQVAQYGGTWPDEHELVPMQGDNFPPEEEELTLWSLEELTDRIEDLGREALARIEGPKIADQDEADRIANLADRLAELWNEVDRRRKEERREHDQALKAIQLKWLPLLAKAESYKNLKYKLLTPWLIELQTAQQQEAEAAAAAGAPTAAEPRRPRAGTRGRAQTLKTQKRAEITNYDLCLAFFKESEDLRGTVQMLANRAVRAGITVPGTTIIEDQKAV